MAKTINAPTLDEVNSALLERLYEMIKTADPEYILDITEAVAKLNSSWKGNNQFAVPETAEERDEREKSAILGELLKG